MGTLTERRPHLQVEVGWCPTGGYAQGMMTGKWERSGQARNVNVQGQNMATPRISYLQKFRKAGSTRDLCQWAGKVSLWTKTQRQSLIFMSAESPGNLIASNGPRSKSGDSMWGPRLSLLVTGQEVLDWPWIWASQCFPNFSAFLVNLQIPRTSPKPLNENHWECSLGICFYEHPVDSCDQEIWKTLTEVIQRLGATPASRG